MALKVYKLNQYEWFVSPWNIDKTIEWYNEEFRNSITRDIVEECDIYTEGMWLKTEDEVDIEELGDSDEIIHFQSISEKLSKVIQFGSLIKKDGSIYKYCSFKVAIEELYDTELSQPELIGTNLW